MVDAEEKMAIRLEFFSLIVPISRIDEHYPGGFKRFRLLFGPGFGATRWHDEYLYREGAMNPGDVRYLVEGWESFGLEPFKELDGKQYWKDMCVVDYFGGPTLPCEWLEHDRDTYSVSLKGEPKGEVIGREEMQAANKDYKYI
jgi:hypothetical protein